MENIKNKKYRYTAYRQFTGLIHNKLGRGVRRIILSCVVNAIRNEFSEDNWIYGGFVGDDETVSELNDC